ncbi:hypothetical protein [Paenibacillus alba]|nr:hypothetical protein [Paenibacillus alba]
MSRTAGFPRQIEDMGLYWMTIVDMPVVAASVTTAPVSSTQLD